MRRPTEDRRAQITDAALGIIATRGIAALSTSSVARAVGLTSGALFRHFASLDAILEAVAERVAGLLASTYPPAELPPRERLERFFVARTAMADEHAGIPRLVLSEQFTYALPERAQKALRAAVRDTHAFVRDAVAEAQREGTIRDDAAPDALAAIVVGTMQMLVTHRSLRTRGSPDSVALRETLFGLLGPPRAAGSTARRKR